MCTIYIATDVPKINYMILLKFHFLGILDCTILCAMLHSFMCKKERSGFREGFYVFRDGWIRDDWVVI